MANSKISEEDKKKIMELYSSGKRIVDISKLMGINPSSVTYWCKGEDYRKKRWKKMVEYFKALPKEQKKKIYSKRKEYYKNYFKNRYHTDPEFKAKHISNVRKYWEKNIK